MQFAIVRRILDVRDSRAQSLLKKRCHVIGTVGYVAFLEEEGYK
jgi:hypothetical protein